MYLQREVPVGQAVYQHGVIEIARGFAIDSDDGQVTKIAAARQVRLRDGLRNAPRFLDHLRWKTVGDVVLADHDLHIHTEFIGGAQHFDHASGRAIAVVAVIQNVHVDNQAIQIGRAGDDTFFHANPVYCRMRGRNGHVGGDRNPVLHALVVGNHEQALPCDAKFANDAGMGALQNLPDCAFGLAIGPGPRHVPDGAVAVHQAARAVAGNEDVALNARNRVIGNQKAVAIAVNAETPGNEFAAIARRGVLTGFDFDQLAFFHQPLQGVFQHGALLAPHAQFAKEMFQAGPAMRQTVDMLKDHGVGHLTIIGYTGRYGTDIMVLMRLSAILFFASSLATSLLQAQPAAPKPAAAVAKASAPAAKAAAPAKNFKESGSPSAPLVIEVYSDYECPSCRALWMDTIPQLIREYVTTGKVRLLHRDFPLPQHQYTRLATRYANAAGQIGRYELVVDQIFKMQPAWAANGNVDAEVAKVLPPGEMQKVRDLVKNDMHLDDSVTADLAQGQVDRLSQTPTMEIVYKGNRQQIAGALPYNVLKSYIDQILSK